jgi:hypothetical protein
VSDRVERQWCVDCGARFTAQEIEGCFACPKCGSAGVPCSVEQDVRVEVNWDELRILGIWAENHARQCAANPGNGGEKMPRTVQAICRRLQRQFPSFAPLTLSQEIAELPKALEEAGIHHGGVVSNVPRPDLLSIHGPGAVGHTALPK